jgi:hypothetical protein
LRHAAPNRIGDEDGETMCAQSSPAALLDSPVAKWDELVDTFRIDDPDALHTFLTMHPTVPALLLEIRRAARRYFGDDPMILRVTVDLEWEDAAPELVAGVQTRRDGQEALEQLHAFDQDWWLPKLEETKAPVLVTIYLV